MNKNLKRKVAKEVLNIFWIFGIVILSTFGLFTYSSIINFLLKNKTNEIEVLQSEIYLSRDFDTKLTDIKLILSIIANEKIEIRKIRVKKSTTVYSSGEKPVNIELTPIQVEKIRNVVYQRKQEIIQNFGGIPESIDSNHYNNCIARLLSFQAKGINRNGKPQTSTYEVAVDTSMLRYVDITFLNEASSDSIISIWNFLISRPEHLGLLLPQKIVTQFQLKSKKDLFCLISQLNISSEEIINHSKAAIIQEQLNTLQRKKSSLIKYSLTQTQIKYYVKILLACLLIFIYPVRILYHTLIWAIKTKNETI